MTTDLQTPLPSHDLGPLRVPSNPLRAAARKADDDGRPALTRQGSMDFLSLLPNGSKATGKIISLSAKLQSNTTRSSIQPSLSASSSSSNLFALHNQPGYKPSHSTSFPAFQGDYVMSAPSPLESAAAAGGPGGVGGGGRRLELGAEIPARKARTYNPPPIPQMGPSALRTSTTSSTSLSSNVTTITTTTSTSSSSSMGPPSSTASVSSTRRTSLRPSTMLKRSTSSSGNVNPYVRAAVLSSSASLSSLAQNPTPTPIPENSPSSSRSSSLSEEPPTRLIKPLKPRLSRSISHASSLSLNLVSSPPKPLVAAAQPPTTTTPQASSSSFISSHNTYSDGSISPTTILAPLPLAPPSPHGPVLVAGGGERKRARLSFQPPPPLNLPLSVGGWATAKKEQQALGSPFLEMGGGADGGMFAGMQEEERESERKPWEERRGSLGEGGGMMEVDEKEEEALGEAFRG